MKNTLLLLLFIATASLMAQTDAYHDNLVQFLSSEYGLPAPTFPFTQTEAQFIARAGSYSATRNEVTANDSLPFTRQINLGIAGGLPNRFSAGINWTNILPVAQGDRMLLVLWLRSPTPGGGEVGIIAERSTDFVKEVELIVDVADTWTRYLIPFEVNSGPYVNGRLSLALHLGAMAQTIEVGGWTLLNYRRTVPFEQLPSERNVDDYGGFEEDAAWRAPAAARIDSLRKSDLTILLRDGDDPLSGSEVRVEMIRHDFDFGTSVDARRVDRTDQLFRQTYFDRLFDLDGAGHGFNAVVFENDLKWPFWEAEVISTHEQVLNAIDVFDERNVDIRGHVLLWPGWGNLPPDLEQNQNDISYLKQRIDDHLVNFLRTLDLDRKVTDWDVINETITNTDIAERLAGTPGYVTGREYYIEVFERARELAPDAELYLNDFVTLSLSNGPGTVSYDNLLRNTRELVEGGAPIDGIGFQGHIGGSPNSIYDVLATYDDFATRFDLDAKVTEFDLPANVPEELAGRYLRDFLTATFSHPSMTGFLFWSFWDGDTFQAPGANLFRQDWSRTPAGDAFIDLVFNQWWTDETLSTNPNGVAQLRGFRGTYEIRFDCNGTTVTDTVTLTGDADLDYDCETLVNSRDPFFEAGSVTATPNPATTGWMITNTLGKSLFATLTDAAGRQVWTGTLSGDSTLVDAPRVSGIYVLTFTDNERTGQLRLVRK